MTKDLPPLDEIEFDDIASIPNYEDMTREELIECCKTHDGHHQEHHANEALLMAENNRLREALEFYSRPEHWMQQSENAENRRVFVAMKGSGNQDGFEYAVEALKGTAE